MTSSNGDRVQRIFADPAFHAAVRRRARFGWGLTALMGLTYFGFIALVAFAPASLGTPLADSTVSSGLVLGLVVIAAAFLLTAVYVLRANTVFDAETRTLLERHP